MAPRRITPEKSDTESSTEAQATDDMGVATTSSSDDQQLPSSPSAIPKPSPSRPSEPDPQLSAPPPKRQRTESTSTALPLSLSDDDQKEGAQVVLRNQAIATLLAFPETEVSEYRQETEAAATLKSISTSPPHRMTQTGRPSLTPPFDDVTWNSQGMDDDTSSREEQGDKKQQGLLGNVGSRLDQAVEASKHDDDDDDEVVTLGHENHKQPPPATQSSQAMSLNSVEKTMEPKYEECKHIAADQGTASPTLILIRPQPSPSVPNSNEEIENVVVPPPIIEQPTTVKPATNNNDNDNDNSIQKEEKIPTTYKLGNPASTKMESWVPSAPPERAVEAFRTFQEQPTTVKARTSTSTNTSTNTMTFVDLTTSSTADLKKPIIIIQAASCSPQPASNDCQERPGNSLEGEHATNSSKSETIEKLAEGKPASTNTGASPIPPNPSLVPSPRPDAFVEESNKNERKERPTNSTPSTTKEMPPPPSRPPQGLPKSRRLSARIRKRKTSPDKRPPVRSPKARKKEPQVAEWAQCDLCDKWRQLPPHISCDTLPTVWHCSSITWGSSLAASCSAPVEPYEYHYALGTQQVKKHYSYIAQVDDDDTETQQETGSDLEMPTPTHKSTKVHSTASPSSRKPKPTKVRRKPSDSVAFDESQGFCVYNLQGGGVKFVITDLDEMDHVFANVLDLAEKNKAKEAPKKNHGAARQTQRTSSRKSTGPKPDVVHSHSSPTIRIPTHDRSTRSQPTTEYASIPYSYGQLDWDSLHGCWKRASHPKVQVNRCSVNDERKPASHPLKTKTSAPRAASGGQAQSLDQNKPASSPAKGSVSVAPAVPDANVSGGYAESTKSKVQIRQPTMNDETTTSQRDAPRDTRCSNVLETADQETVNPTPHVGRFSNMGGGNSANQKRNRAEKTAKTRPEKVTPGFYEELDDLATDMPIRAIAANNCARSSAAVETFDPAGERRVSASDASVSLVSMYFPDHIQSQSTPTLELRRHDVAHMEDPRKILRHWGLTAVAIILVGILMLTVSPTVIASYLFAFWLGVVFVYKGERQLLSTML
jgi:hypothetical protein